MSIIINIDVMLAKRKMSVTELSEKVGITMANLSILKNGKAKAVRQRLETNLNLNYRLQPHMALLMKTLKNDQIGRRDDAASYCQTISFSIGSISRILDPMNRARRAVGTPADPWLSKTSRFPAPGRPSGIR